MGYKTILVHCDAGRGTAARLKIALDLGQRFDAHVIGLHVRQAFQAPAFTDAGPAMDSLYKTYETVVKADEAIATAAFREAVGSKGVSSEWRVADGYVDEVVRAEARTADLVIVGQAEPDPLPTATPADLAEDVAMAGECPVLIVPYIGVAKPPGRTVMLCWNASREAKRAASGALPLLKTADKVIVLIIDPKTRRRQRRAGRRRRLVARPSWREGDGAARHRCRFRRRRRDPVTRRRSRCRSHRHGDLRPFAHARTGAGRRQPHAAGQHDRAAAGGALRPGAASAYERAQFVGLLPAL